MITEVKSSQTFRRCRDRSESIKHYGEALGSAPGLIRGHKALDALYEVFPIDIFFLFFSFHLDSIIFFCFALYLVELEAEPV